MLTHFSHLATPVGDIPTRHLWEVYDDLKMRQYLTVSITGGYTETRSATIDEIMQISTVNQWPTYLIDLRGTHGKAVFEQGGIIAPIQDPDAEAKAILASHDPIGPQLTSFDLSHLDIKAQQAIFPALIDTIWNDSRMPMAHRKSLLIDDVEPLVRHDNLSMQFVNLLKSARKALLSTAFSIPGYLYSGLEDEDVTNNSIRMTQMPIIMNLIHPFPPGRYPFHFGPLGVIAAPDGSIISKPLLHYPGGACIIE